MVRKISNTRFILPGGLALLLALSYYLFGTKIFLASLVMAVGGFLSLIDIRIAIFGVTFIMPFLMPFSPSILVAASYFGVGLVYFVRRLFVEKKNSIKSIYFGVIFIYLLVIVIQSFTSVNLVGSLRDLFIHTAGIMYLFAVVNSIRTKKDFNSYLTVLMAAVTIVALIGLVQIFTGVEIAREWLDVENNPDMRVRIFSIFGNPNTLAEYLVIFTPLAVGMFWHTKSLKKKVVFGAGVASMLIALVFTMSRGGWIGIAMAALIFCILVDKRLLLLSVPILLVALVVLPDSIVNRILSIGNFADTSNAHRFNVWNISKALIKDHPVAGVGFGYVPFKQVYETYSRTINSYHAHNSYLETIAELGFVGFGVFMAMLVTFVRYPINALVKKYKGFGEDSYFKYIGVGVAAGIVGVFTHGLVENILYLPKIILAFWTLVTVGAAAVNIVEDISPIVVNDKDQSVKIYRRSEIDG